MTLGGHSCPKIDAGYAENDNRIQAEVLQLRCRSRSVSVAFAPATLKAVCFGGRIPLCEKQGRHLQTIT